jgi:hypothetical protein
MKNLLNVLPRRLLLHLLTPRLLAALKPTGSESLLVLLLLLPMASSPSASPVLLVVAALLVVVLLRVLLLLLLRLVLWVLLLLLLLLRLALLWILLLLLLRLVVPLLLPPSLAKEKKKKPGTLPSSFLIWRKNLGHLLHYLPTVLAALPSSTRAPTLSLPSLALQTGRPIWPNALGSFRLRPIVTIRGEMVLRTSALLFWGSLLGLVQTTTIVVKAPIVLFVLVSLTYILLFYLLVICFISFL